MLFVFATHHALEAYCADKAGSPLHSPPLPPSRNVQKKGTGASLARRRKSVFGCQRLRLCLTSLRPVFFARPDLTLAATRRRDLFLLVFAFDFARLNFEAVATARLRLCRGAVRFDVSPVSA